MISHFKFKNELYMKKKKKKCVLFTKPQPAHQTDLTHLGGIKSSFCQCTEHTKIIWHSFLLYYQRPLQNIQCETYKATSVFRFLNEWLLWDVVFRDSKTYSLQLTHCSHPYIRDWIDSQLCMKEYLATKIIIWY